MDTLEHLKTRLREFVAARDWEQFHSPKNLSMALSVEAAELLEQFQWLTEAQSRSLADERRTAVEHEIADVQIYLVRLADTLGIDIGKAVAAKLELNGKKYPVEMACRLRNHHPLLTRKPRICSIRACATSIR